MVKKRRAQKQDNKEKKPTKTRQRKKQKTKHDDTDQEDSNSTTDLNNQSDSLYSPTSAKKPLMVDSMKIDSTRRASLRLSKNKNLIKTGIACSNPPKPKEDLRKSPQKSIEHFPSSHAIRQLDDLAHQVLQGSKVESPARYLKKVGQNFRYREIEKGGECVAEEITDELDDIIGRMEKGKEAEKEVPLAEKLADADNEVSGALQTYQIPQNSQVESPSRYLIQGEPSLRHEQIVEKGGKEVSLVQKPTSMATLGLTEFINRYREIEKGGECIAEEIPDELEDITDELDDLIAKMKEGKKAEEEVPLAEKRVDEDNELESRERSLSNGQHIILDNFEVVSARIASFNTPRETGMTDLSNLRKHFPTTHDMQQLHDLAYQVPQSSQVESPSRYLKQGEPSLRHEEIEKDGRVAAEENLGDGIGEKQVSLVERSISMVSLGITEFVKNMVADEDDEVDSRRCDMDIIERYQVKPESMPILRKILTKYGDIAKNSTASTMLLSGSLETICGIISQMQGKNLRQIKQDFLIYNIGLVENIKNVGVDIEWLHVLLRDILDTKEENFGKLKEEKESNKKIVDDVERRLTECRERQRELSDLLSMAKDESTRITQNIKSAKAKYERFLDCFPVDLLF